MVKVDIFSAKGIKSGKADLPFDAGNINMVLLAQAVRVYRDRMYPGTSKVKTRGEVKASTRKIYRQKGTGGARHGAKSAPIFVGGGVAHGPKGVKRVLQLSSKMKQIALHSALSLKAKEGEIKVVNNLADIVKSKQAQELVNKLVAADEKMNAGSKFLFALSQTNSQTAKALSNLGNVSVVAFKDLNAFIVLSAKFVVMEKSMLDNIAPVVEKASKSKVKDALKRTAVPKTGGGKTAGKSAKPSAKTKAENKKATKTDKSKAVKTKTTGTAKKGTKRGKSA
jgi:large subunit ribosomal protein L4